MLPKVSVVLRLRNPGVKGMDFVVGLPGFESSFLVTSYVTLAETLNLSVIHLQIRVMIVLTS